MTTLLTGLAIGILATVLLAPLLTILRVAEAAERILHRG